MFTLWLEARPLHKTDTSAKIALVCCRAPRQKRPDHHQRVTGRLNITALHAIRAQIAGQGTATTKDARTHVHGPDHMHMQPCICHKRSIAISTEATGHRYRVGSMPGVRHARAQIPKQDAVRADQDCISLLPFNVVIGVDKTATKNIITCTRNLLRPQHAPLYDRNSLSNASCNRRL